MRVDDLMLFALVVRLKSFRAAAVQRGVASSVVSKHISRLESDLGTQLLRRSTRKLNLTEAGELLYRHCQTLEQNVEMASEELSAYRAEPSGVLRISAPGVSGQLFLPKVIRRFMARYPEVEVDMVIQDRFDDLIEQGFDLAIRTGTLEDSSLICKRLVTSCWHAFASPSYLQQHGSPQSLEELTQHECLLFSHQQTGEADWPCISPEGEASIRVNGRFRANSLLALCEAALDGMGIAFLPLYMVRHERASGELVPVMESLLYRRVGIYALYPQSRYLPPKTRAFIELLEAMYAEEEALFRH
ncbi:LysR family transcriptional regulator [Motiliproteus coralliicola]|uniref:LysR family transcriptional regulator n=1 Tax=Motiliproteus coralliicola TaxID=2283196 RepID=A0A369WPC6_9GAMM|nr:LysR family transcriptional regulator [Motiliproteus coralliicola]RDE22919.1 LysR family transcriptional regulator [Motiliproteus coralliicola]